MSRAICLTKIHALNWYGYRDSIPVSGNLLLAGLTGSGKSILMDLLQLVLVGDQRLVRFNQSATGDRSERTLKGYCLGDTKQEEDGVTQYMRDSCISYVGLEFTWPGTKKRCETWGIRVEFASAAEQHGKVTPFMIPAALDRADFLDSQKRPLDYTAWKAATEQRQGRLYTEGLEAYLRDMAQPTHLNFDRNILRSLLPSAMSFTFLKSFNDFCRHFILPSDRLDISDVTASYRTFQRYEKDLVELNDQLERLREIHGLATRHAQLQQDKVVARYLEAELRQDWAKEQLRDGEETLGRLKQEFGEEERRIAELDEQVRQITGRIEEIKALINQTPEGQLYSFIKNQNRELVHRIEELKGIGRTLESALEARLRKARSWTEQLCNLPLKLDASHAQTLERTMAAAEAGGLAGAEAAFRTMQGAIAAATVDAERAATPQLDRLRVVRKELGQLREEIAALEIGKLPFPTRLLDALNSAKLRARHLRELCEVADERWRPAIEVAFTRKFAVVVEPECYDEAERVYHGLREETPRESLIHPGKALKGSRKVQPESLAEKLTPQHPVAAAVIANLFGDVICVEKREQLREHDLAIMPDGFMSRGAFVERARHYDNLPFVGERGLQQQRVYKQTKLQELATEEARLRPLEEDLRAVQSTARELMELPSNLQHDLVRALELPKLEETLQGNIEKLNSIDRAKFDNLAQQQGELEQQLTAGIIEQRQLLQSPKRFAIQQLEHDLERRRQEAQRFADRFEQVKHAEDISLHLARLQEMRTEALGTWTLEVAANRFRDHFVEWDKESTALWEQLKAARRELAQAHPRFDDLPVESVENTAHEKQLQRLEESEIREYKEKAERERRNWEHLFRTQVLEKLRTALHDVEDTIILLNRSLKQPIGNNRYQIRFWQNPDFKMYHRLLEASALAHEDELFFASASAELKDAIAHFLRVLTETPDSAEALRLLDYRHYYEYDMEVEDVRDPSLPVSRVDKHSGKFSGGENQSPYFIAILASYLRAYKRYSKRDQAPSLALVPIDEAFSKLSGERIRDCIRALQTLDLQGVFSMSTGNIPYAFEHCDWLVVVAKEEKRVGKKTLIRNTPVSLARDSDQARKLVGGD